jgi:hypothetical protein
LADEETSPETVMATSSAVIGKGSETTDSLFVKIDNFPSSGDVSSVRTFFSGLSVDSVFLSPVNCKKYYIFVKFGNINGAKLGLIRSGESFSCFENGKQLVKKLAVSPVSKLVGFWVENCSILLISHPVEKYLSFFQHPSLLSFSSSLFTNPDEASLSYYKKYCSFRSVVPKIDSFMFLFQIPLAHDKSQQFVSLKRNHSDHGHDCDGIQNIIDDLWKMYGSLIEEMSILLPWITKRIHFYSVLSQIFTTLTIQKALSQALLF